MLLNTLMTTIRVLSEFVRADVVGGRNRPSGDVSQPGPAKLLSCAGSQVASSVVYGEHMKAMNYATHETLTS